MDLRRWRRKRSTRSEFITRRSELLKKDFKAEKVNKERRNVTRNTWKGLEAKSLFTKMDMSLLSLSDSREN